MIETLLLAALLASSPAHAAAGAPARSTARATARAAANAPAAAHKLLGEPVADSLLTEPTALAWVGGPLGATFTDDAPAEAANGHDHVSVRGWFPEGFDPRTADAPPARGIQVTVHAFPDSEAAAMFLGHVRGRDEDSVGRTGGPFAKFTLSAIDGLGDEAHVKSGPLPANGGGEVSLATLSVRRGRVFLQMQVWMADGTALEVAKRAAREMVARLP